MSRIHQKRRREQMEPLGGKKELEGTLRRQMATAAGTTFFQHRAPLYHVTESFQQTFDAMGAKHAREAVGGFEDKENTQNTPQERQRDQTEPQTKDMPDPTSARSFYERGGGQDQDMIRRFSETAFQRGNMSAAVLQGTGKMMLFSCLKKTVGQSQPVKAQQRKLFENASQTRNVPGHTPDKVTFNRGFAHSAVGLVVDTLRDARRTVEDMQALAMGGMAQTESGGYGAETLREMYPFLDDSHEREMLEQYYARLNGPEALSADEKGLLQNAVDRTRGLMDKQARMKTEFINKLRFISDRATEALAEFEQPGFTEAVSQALADTYGAEDPPDDGEGTDGNGTAEPETNGSDPKPDTGTDSADAE